MEAVLSGASQKGSLALWDLRRGLTVRQYRQSPPVKKGCVAMLGEHFFLVASDQKMTSSGKLKKTPNSQTVAWTFDNETVHSQSFIPHPISSFVGSPCGQYVFGGTAEGALVIWHTHSGRQLHLFANLYQPITAMVISPTNEWLSVGCEDGIIHVLRVSMLLSGNANESEAMTFSNHSLPISGLCFSATSRRLYSCSLDQTCKIWSMDISTLLCSVSFPTLLNCVTISPMEDSIYVGGVDGNIYRIDLWDVKSNDFSIVDNIQKLPQIFKGQNSVNSIDLNLDGSLLVSGSDDGCIRVWSSSTCQLIQTYQQHKGPVTHVSVSLKPSSTLVSGYVATSKTVPQLMPLNPLTYETTNLDVLPIKLPLTNIEHDKFMFLDHQQSRHFDKKIKLTRKQFDTNQDLYKEIETLKNEIVQLKEVNSRWKSLSNEMLVVTLVNT